MTPETGRDLAELILLIHPDDREKVETAIANIAETGGEYAVDYRVIRSDGVRVFQARGMTTPGPDGLPHLLHGAVWDVTDLFAAQAATRESEERLRTALEAATWGSAIIEPDGRISVVNQALCDLLGRDRETLVGMRCQRLLHPDEPRVASPGLESTEARELRLAGPDGRAIWVQLSSAPVVATDGTVLHHVVHVHDATERKSFEAELQHLADHDALTGLLNRRRFGEELERVVGDGRSRGAVVMLDLDGLKAVNDTLGHAVGDAHNVTVADFQRERLRDTDVAARLGGDEFAIVAPGADAAAALAVSTDILHRLRDAAPLASAQGRPAASACAGIALYGPGYARTDEELMTQADLALYEAKDAGRGCARVFAPSARDVVFRPGVRWSDRIRAALAEDRFVLLGQPIRSLHDDPVERQELLLRMLGEDGELLLPSAFLLAAERSSLIQAIDRWVLRRAADALAAHQAAGRRVSFAVNLSARSMTDPAMADYVRETLAAAGADGCGLVLEITETAAVVNVSRARSFARALQASGCELALDDFGAGFTSFRYLKHLDFDYVKIDGAFVHDLASSHTSRCLVQSLSDMAHNLGKRTIAEHVGDDATEGWLRTHGIDYVQGFHVGRPAPLPGPWRTAGSVTAQNC
jgi:diguanylate cyclase (GGDEF)-like protein/PAS domain S-box-containing protein